MRMRLYNALVNRHSGIKERYHRYRQGGGAKKKLLTYLYLLGLNLLYYLFRRKDLALTEQARYYEKKSCCMVKANPPKPAGSCPSRLNMPEGWGSMRWCPLTFLTR